MLRRWTAIAMAVALAACSDSTAADIDINGTYTLRTFDGSTVPTSRQIGATLAEILSGSVTLKEDGSYSVVIVDRSTTGGVTTTETFTETGTFAVSGTTIVLKENNTHSTSGTLVNGTMTLAGEDGSYVFKK
jgi:hypothetical protein